MVRYYLLLATMCAIQLRAQDSFVRDDIKIGVFGNQVIKKASYTEAYSTKADFNKSGMLRATATFAVGKPFNVNTLHAYIKGELEYQMEERWSVRSEIYYMVGNTGGASNKYFDEYHSLFTGLSYHFTKKRQFDPYLGLQAGVLWSELTTPLSTEEPLYEIERTSVDPLISLHGGFNYYATNYFHLFMNVRYLYGVRTAPGSIRDLSELRFSFGLGFNINVKRKK